MADKDTLAATTPALALAHDFESYLTERETAAQLRVSMRTLQRWRQEGSGPPYFRFNGRVAYGRQRNRQWADEQLRHSTSEAGHDAA